MLYSVLGGTILMILLLLPVFYQDYLIIPALKLKAPDETAPQGAASFLVTTPDGKDIQVWVTGNGPPLIVCHGNSDNLGTFWERQQRFAEIGYTTYVFDYRGVGNSTGWPSQEGIFTDADAVLRDVAARHGVEIQSVMLVGISLGTGPVSYLIERYGIENAVLFTPYWSISEVVQNMPLFKWYIPLLRYEFPNWSFLSRPAAMGDSPSSLVVLHSRVDELIPFDHGARLCEAARTNHECELIEHGASNHHEIVEHLWDEMALWLQQKLA